ncbi:FAD/FMN-containing dehydrogenase [Halopseudomonas xinjiangensis]|uniref:FAD/FMN-containing dehydrogenase n=1 Tax=Halopseudomonas xinjiangensis TaxID=487184 RepID=A0A1H1SKX6_9GAMM|nr:FAD-binding and (Fe-S)-binding domain-containing protein [Halopseudomonas xinjiangensis]SDS48680.1 FAD/FMN-containing dehydrogenase [Halopseudomonas xinjiangensis]
MIATRNTPDKLSIEQAAELGDELRQRIRGEVRFDKGSRALYATDGSLYRQVPIGVVVPRTLDDVVETVALCRERQLPILARGAGTSLAGQCCNVAVVIDFTKYLSRITHLDPDARLARVEPGCVLDHLRDAAEEHHLTFGPDPSTHAHNTLGGMLGNNSCGVHSVMAGRTADNVRRLRVLTCDGLDMWVGPTTDRELEQIISEGGRRGEIYAGLRDIRDRYDDLIRSHYPDIPRRVSGYNLDELLPEKGFNVARALVGSEGTCVTILEAELELVPSPRHRCVLMLGYPDVYATGEHVAEILRFGPTGLEGMDHLLVNEMQRKDMHPEARQMLPEGHSWLLVEFGGDTAEEAGDKARAAMQELEQADQTPTMALFEDPDEQAMIWKTREASLGATSRSPMLGDTFPGWEDAAVPPERVGEYLCAFRNLMHKYGYEAALYGHFGNGCVHCRINFELCTDSELARWRTFMTEAADLVVSFGGSLSGEHGDGQVRAELLPRMYGESLMAALREFKTLWDPQGLMNPGKVVDPYPMDQALRTGPGFVPPATRTRMAFGDDRFSFYRAANRCVGIGECRNDHGGVMCPSYRATRDEQHSTRGRSRLLFEMLQGKELDGGWRNESVRDALDLCLACKGCKQDCPVSVDMATLKAEFMHQHYKGRLRPRAAYALSQIWPLSRIASRLPRLSNALLHGPLGKLAKRVGGVAEERDLPHYAVQTFSAWFTKRGARNQGLPPVLLWPDTFHNHFYPDLLQAAVRVLEAAGYQVLIPPRPLCCGRPLYAEGMLDQAARQLRDIIETLGDEAMRDVPVVGLEPSCVTAFRDELRQLHLADERAHGLAERAFLLTEFLQREGYHPPILNRRAVVHVHCHQYAALQAESDSAMLARMGVEHRVLDAGCCGMAGSFGYDAEKYQVSIDIAEQQLAPALRSKADDEMVITNGFSCREQIAHTTGQRAWHMAEVLDLALAEGERNFEVLASTGRGR